MPLSWDRRHSLNATLTMGTPGDFIASLIARFGSGLPYTPSLVNQRTGLGEQRHPSGHVHRGLLLHARISSSAGSALSVFLKVYNLFDTANELNVFGDTGRAGYTLELTRAQEAPRGANTLEAVLYAS